MSKLNLTHKGFTGSSEVSFDDDCLHGKVQFIDDLISYEGNTPSELKESFIAAVDRYLDYCKQTGKPANKPYSGTFNVRVGADLHRKAAECAQRRGVPLNEVVARALQVAVDHDGLAKVEHVHKHEVTIPARHVFEDVIVTMERPTAWGQINATAH
jgi:predicted HicB family RNase H-like nuclease